MRESEGVEKPVTRYAIQKGFIARKLKWQGRVGAPDHFYSSQRTGPFLIEFKAPGKPLDLHQDREITRLRNAGMTVHVIDNTQAGYALFD